jgi:hypothetical protein
MTKCIVRSICGYVRLALWALGRQLHRLLGMRPAPGVYRWMIIRQGSLLIGSISINPRTSLPIYLVCAVHLSINLLFRAIPFLGHNCSHNV